MKNFKALVLASAILALSGAAFAASHAGAPMGTMKKDMPMNMGDGKKDAPMAGASAMTDGEIRKVDMEAKKVTIKHGEIKNLDMPPMSMVFQVKDAAMLAQVKTGDKVKFKAEKEGTAFVITEIQSAK